MYSSRERSLCRQLCGWGVLHGAPLHHNQYADADDVIGDVCEWENDGFYNSLLCCFIYSADMCERRAALALWHGSVQNCVNVIQEYITICRERATEENDVAIDEGAF